MQQKTNANMLVNKDTRFSFRVMGPHRLGIESSFTNINWSCCFFAFPVIPRFYFGISYLQDKILFDAWLFISDRNSFLSPWVTAIKWFLHS